MSPGRVIASVGTGDFEITVLPPYLSTTTCVSTVSTPRVAMTRASGLAVRSGRITRKCTATPSAAQMSTAATERHEQAVPVLGLEPVDEVGADQGEAGLREVDDARAAVDDHEPEAEQGVDAAGPEAEQREAEQVGHGLSWRHL